MSILNQLCKTLIEKDYVRLTWDVIYTWPLIIPPISYFLNNDAKLKGMSQKIKTNDFNNTQIYLEENTQYIKI